MRTSSLVFALVLLAGCASHQASGGHPQGHGGVHAFRFDDAERWAKHFEDPARDEWQKPDEVVRALALAPDAKVADIGAATGYFPVRLARAVPQGQVYGVDIEPSMVEYLRARAEREGLANLEAVLAATDDPRLPEPVDLVLLVNTYHHVPGRVDYFARLRGSLRPGGRVAVIDARPDAERGPPREERLAPETVAIELTQAGYAAAGSFDFLPDQYFLVFTVP